MVALETVVYSAVVFKLRCPSNAWMMRMLVPESSKCVAKLCRNIRGFTILEIPAARRALAMALCMLALDMGIPGVFPGKR